MSTAAAGSGMTTRSPYVGLVPYTAEDRAFFHGRDTEQRLLMHAALASKLTLVYGPGGAGKSSLLLAGVVPDLRERGERRRNDDGGPDLLPVVFRSWQDGTVELRRTIAGAIGAEGLEYALPASLADTAEAVTETVRTRLVVVLDQLEEYFVYREQGRDATFVDELAECLARPRLRASFLLSIREDALGQLDEFTRRIPQVFENAFRLENLTRDAARRAIVGPAAAVGASIEDGLVEAVIDQTAAGRISLGSSGLGLIAGSADAETRVEPAYLQLVMSKLWEEASRRGSPVLGRDLLERLGGAEWIVATHLDGELTALTPDALAVAAELLRLLVTPSGASIAHAASDLASYVERPLDEVVPVLEELARVRILRPIAPSTVASEPRYEIFHSALAPAVRDWLRRFELSEERRRAESSVAAERRNRRRRASMLLFLASLLGLVVIQTVLLMTR